MSRIHFEKCIVGHFHHCVNIIKCTYRNLNDIAYYIPRLYGVCRLWLLGCKPVWHVPLGSTICNYKTIFVSLNRFTPASPQLCNVLECLDSYCVPKC